MHYLIDGYNLLFRLSESKKNLETARKNIISSIQIEFAALVLEGTIVFDGAHRRGEESGLSYRSPLVIAYSPSGETADQAILERLEIARTPADITVVSNDRKLIAEAKRLHAKTLSLNAFLSHLEKKHAKSKQHEEDRPAYRESKKELDRLLKIFEARLRENR
jgi:predicted RNA-binding protein with PIN domain